MDEIKQKEKIKVENISFVRKKKILSDINFTINQGERIAIIGPNGAGKTTLVSIILDLQKATSGMITSEYSKLPRYKVGVHLQDGKLNSLMKVKEILALFSFEKSEIDFIEKFNLTKLLDKYFGALSGGEKQKIFLVLALQNNPELIVLDEMTTGLDLQTRNLVTDFLKNSLNEFNTLIMVSHYLEEVEKIANRVLLINEGKLVADLNSTDINEMKKKKVITFKLLNELETTSFSELYICDVERNDDQIKLICPDENEFMKILNGLNEDPLISSIQTRNYALEDFYLAKIKEENEKIN